VGLCKGAISENKDLKEDLTRFDFRKEGEMEMAEILS
jgi:hypothetical protein